MKDCIVSFYRNDKNEDPPKAENGFFMVSNGADKWTAYFIFTAKLDPQSYTAKVAAIEGAPTNLLSNTKYMYIGNAIVGIVRFPEPRKNT